MWVVKNNENDFKDERLAEFCKILEHGVSTLSFDDGLKTNANHPLSPHSTTQQNDSYESKDDTINTPSLREGKGLMYDIIALQEMFGALSRRRRLLLIRAALAGYQ
jgi:hypothetical protein